MENVAMNAAFWTGKKVLITGHTGFKGSWLSLCLQRVGAVTVGYSLTPPSEPNLYTRAHVTDGMTSVLGDVRDVDTLHRTIREVEPEIIFHLAAQSLVRQSYLDPLTTYSTNVMGTAAVLDGVRRTPGVRVAVVVTSDKCYESREWDRGYGESDRLGGRDPYSSSKACAELVTAAYRDSFFTNAAPHGSPVAVASARAGNVIGGGDWAADRLIPDLVRAWGAGRVAEIRYPNAVRPWQHVLEPLFGYMLLAERLWEEPRLSGAWNFGPPEAEARTVREVVEEMVALWGDNATWRSAIGSHPHETTYLRLDWAKAREELGWQPQWTLAKSLAQTVGWYRSDLRGADARTLVEQQITEYLETSLAQAGA